MTQDLVASFILSKTNSGKLHFDGTVSVLRNLTLASTPGPWMIINVNESLV